MIHEAQPNFMKPKQVTVVVLYCIIAQEQSVMANINVDFDAYGSRTVIAHTLGGGDGGGGGGLLLRLPWRTMAVTGGGDRSSYPRHVRHRIASPSRRVTPPPSPHSRRLHRNTSRLEHSPTTSTEQSLISLFFSLLLVRDEHYHNTES